MLRAYDRDVRNLVPCAPLTSADWIHARDPSAEELAGIAKELGVSPSLLGHALDIDEVARCTEDPSGVTFVIIRVPWLLDTGKKTVPRATAFGVAVSKKNVVTITRVDTDVLEPLVQWAANGVDHTLQFAVWVVHAAAERFLFHLRGIEERIDRLEAKIEEEFHNSVILELLDEQKNLVHLTTALRSNKIMLEQLGEHAPKPVHASIEDAMIELRQAIETAQVERDMLTQTMNAFTSIVSNNLNDAMKFLTALTIVLTVPMIIAGLWGMNVSLPGDDLSMAFWYLVALSTGLSGVLAVWFWRRGWL